MDLSIQCLMFMYKTTRKNICLKYIEKTTDHLKFNLRCLGDIYKSLMINDVGHLRVLTIGPVYV